MKETDKALLAWPFLPVVRNVILKTAYNRRIVMANKSCVLLFGIILAFANCKEKIPEQLIFENLAPCECAIGIPCQLARTKQFEFNNLLGTIKSNTHIYSDSLWKIEIPESIYPMWKYKTGEIQVCNMPERFLKGDQLKKYKVRFSFKTFYVDKNYLGGGSPEWGGYPAELTRLEILE